MPHFTTRRIVPHTPEQMFDLVADVERYPQFLPLCESLTVLSREPIDGGERIIARMSVGYGLVRETFKTDVRLLRQTRQIAVRYLEGPFRHLDNTWDFRPGDFQPHAGGGPAQVGCEVVFFIDYEFRSLPLQLLMGAMFDRAFRKFAEAFEARAAQVYGQPAPST